ncbi:inner centromere protein A-like [Galleria mellonella]|uniref:Inner centromere protein A-like n=1 Tax=Galleria mellonella TaxID=7137 RepID=A0ABM3MR96_GALME|nr:inner centromere protein A-like [Galleria mellonella]
MNYSDSVEWERKKDFIIRSLFVDLPTLSPVPEEEHSPRESVRAVSPLPPLIIEKEPNRHDEPEEFYQELEIKMRKLYRKLFLNDDSISLDDLDDLSSYLVPDFHFVSERYDQMSVVDYVHKIDKVQGKTKITDKLTTSFCTEQANDSERKEMKQIKVKYEDVTEPGDQETLSEQSSNCLRQIICKADVHNEATDVESDFSLIYEDEKVYSFKKSFVSTNAYHSGKVVEKKEPDADQTDEREASSDGTEKRTNSIQEIINLDTSDDVESSRSIEVVRSQIVRRQSMGTVHASEDSSQNEVKENTDFGSRKMSQIHCTNDEWEDVSTSEVSGQSFHADIKLCSLSSENRNTYTFNMESEIISPPSPFKDKQEQMSYTSTEDSNQNSETYILNLGMRLSTSVESDSNQNKSDEIANLSSENNIESNELEEMGITSTPLVGRIIDNTATELNRSGERKSQRVHYKRVTSTPIPNPIVDGTEIEINKIEEKELFTPIIDPLIDETEIGLNRAREGRQQVIIRRITSTPIKDPIIDNSAGEVSKIKERKYQQVIITRATSTPLPDPVVENTTSGFNRIEERNSQQVHSIRVTSTALPDSIVDDTANEINRTEGRKPQQVNNIKMTSTPIPGSNEIETRLNRAEDRKSQQVYSIRVPSTPVVNPVLDDNATQLNSTGESMLQQEIATEKASTTKSFPIVDGTEMQPVQARTRKRKHRRVHWEDLKSNLFVGTPKIFKLCSCKDHVCSD